MNITIKLDKPYQIRYVHGDATATQELFEWAKSKVVDPIEQLLNMPGWNRLTEHQQDMALTDAFAVKRQALHVNSPEIKSQCGTPEGLMKFMQLTWCTNGETYNQQQLENLSNQAAEKYSDYFAAFNQDEINKIDELLETYKVNTWLNLVKIPKAKKVLHNLELIKLSKEDLKDLESKLVVEG